MHTLFPEVRPIAEHSDLWVKATAGLRHLRDATCYTILTTADINAKIALSTDVHTIQLALDCALRRKKKLVGDHGSPTTPVRTRRNEQPAFLGHPSSAAVLLADLRTLLESSPDGAAVSEAELSYIVRTLDHLRNLA